MADVEYEGREVPANGAYYYPPPPAEEYPPPESECVERAAFLDRINTHGRGVQRHVTRHMNGNLRFLRNNRSGITTELISDYGFVRF